MTGCAHAGAGPGHELSFTGRVIATLVILRSRLPHAALAVSCGVDRSAITRAVHEIRPLPPARGFAVPGKRGLRLKTLADGFAYADSQGCGCGLTAPRCRPAAPRPGGLGGGRSCLRRRSRTRSSPP
jgi:hypothetical protein